MSRSAKIKKPKWTDPKDIAYLSFFGTLFHGLQMQEVRFPAARLELKRRTVPFDPRMLKKESRSLPAPARSVPVTEAQRMTLQSIAAVARKTRYEPRALPGHSDLLTIEMIKVSDGRAPVYARR
jgi:hypothetical protein